MHFWHKLKIEDQHLIKMPDPLSIDSITILAERENTLPTPPKDSVKWAEGFGSPCLVSVIFLGDNPHFQPE